MPFAKVYVPESFSSELCRSLKVESKAWERAKVFLVLHLSELDVEGQRERFLRDPPVNCVLESFNT
jgi:hypothetical protein